MRAIRVLLAVSGVLWTSLATAAHAEDRERQVLKAFKELCLPDLHDVDGSMARARAHGWSEAKITDSDHLVQRERARLKFKEAIKPVADLKGFSYRKIVSIRIAGGWIYGERRQNEDRTRPHFCYVHDPGQTEPIYGALFREWLGGAPTKTYWNLGSEVWEQPGKYPKALRIESLLYRVSEKGREAGRIGARLMVSQRPPR